MKQVHLRKFADFSTADILKLVIENNPQGMNAAEIRKRIRVLDQIDAANGEVLLLEDADHATLAAALNEFKFAKATRDLVTMIDDVTAAKAAPLAPDVKAA